MNLTEQWKKYLEELTDPEKIDISTPYITNSKNLLDSLDISHLCCRTHIITHADFYKYLVNRTEL